MSQAIRKHLAWLIIATLAVSACEPLPHDFDELLSSSKTRKEQATPLPVPKVGPGVPDPAQDAVTQEKADLSDFPTKNIKVGLLVPLTGRSASIGKALRDAGVLALFDKYASLSGAASSIQVDLVMKDTGGTSEGAKQAAAEAVNEGAQLLIGPLYSHSVEAIKPLAATGKISIMSFSNNPGVASDGVYVMGFSPDEQTKRIAGHTFTTEVNRIAVMAPNNAYGRRVVTAMRNEAKLVGREATPIVYYTPTGVALSEDVKKLEMEGKANGRLNFEALFLPEGGEPLGVLLNQLMNAGITTKNVQFIGTGLWDDRDLARLHDLSGAWFASSPPDMYSAFEDRFITSYGYKPPRIASLAYDAVALAATLATTGTGFNRSVITNPNGYSGPANGIFRFRKDGLVERGLAVMKVENNGFTVIDPAPVNFLAR
ncbi:MAG: penicillin-binding protein activator [Rickettsiales bacterium]|nr:penicillin-binding protein activator [Rickettsiales bacterium]